MSLSDGTLCVCSHEMRLHSLEKDGARGLCIKDEWCQCPGFHPNADYDPTPWCTGCGAMKKSDCDCGPIANNE